MGPGGYKSRAGRKISILLDPYNRDLLTFFERCKS